jgi:hypothetical protein
MVMFNPTQWLKPSLLSALMGVGVLFAATPASAEPCGPNDACPRGFMCQSYGTKSCPEPRPCPPDDAECVKQQSFCMEPAQEVKECVPAPCQVNADCADGMVCFTQEFSRCSSGGSVPACAPSPDGGMIEDCKQAEPPPPPECTTEKYSQCVPRYVPPCQQDADCGPGFLCKEEIQTSCTNTGTGGKGGCEPALPVDGVADAGVPVDGGSSDFAPPPPAPEPERTAPECTTQPTGRFHCELQRVECKQTSDCPTGFSCESEWKDYACTAPAMNPPADGAFIGVADAGIAYDGGSSSGSAGDAAERDAAPAVDGGIPMDAPLPPPPCEMRVAPMICMPPYARDVAHNSGDAGFGGVGSGIPPMGTSAPRPEGGDAGISQDGTNKGESADKDEEDDAKPVLKCSAGSLGAGGGSSLGLLALLGLGAVITRRRRARR